MCPNALTTIAASVVGVSFGSARLHAEAPPLPPTWTVHEAGKTIHAETATQVVSGSDGSVTVLGSAFLPSTSDDVLVIRYGPDGALSWLRRFDSREHGSDLPGSIAAAPDGGVWFSTQCLLAEPRIVVTRLDAAGEVEWSTTRAVQESDLVPKSLLNPRLAVDLGRGTPRIYVTVSDGGAYRILRLDDDGDEVWDIDWKSKSSLGHRPTDVAIGTSGMVYITGLIPGEPSAYGTIGVSADGEVGWSHFQSGAIGSIQTDPLVRAHPSGGAIVAGSPETGCGGFEMRVWSIADDGSERWDVTEDEAPCGTTFGPTALAVAPDGRVATCAANIPTGWRTLVLDSEGTELWDTLWPNEDSAGDFPLAIAFDPDGGVVVTGSRQPAPALDGFGVIRYDATGTEAWQWSAPNPTAGAGLSIAFGGDGACVTAGRNWGGPAVGERAVTMRFDPPTVPCPADLDGDGAVGGADLSILLGGWGARSGDIDGSGATDGVDLSMLLGSWGACSR